MWKCYISLTTLDFISNKAVPGKSAEETRQGRLNSEKAVGILSALILGVSGTIFFNSTGSSSLSNGTIAVSFLSCMVLIGAAQMSFGVSLMLYELRQEEVIPFIDQLGSLNRASGLLFLLGTVLWTFAITLYLYEVVHWLIFVAILVTYLAGVVPLATVALRIMSAFYRARLLVEGQDQKFVSNISNGGLQEQLLE